MYFYSNQHVDLALPFATYMVIVEGLDDCKPDVPLTTMVRMDWGDKDYRRTKKEEDDFKVKKSTMLFDVHKDAKRIFIPHCSARCGAWRRWLLGFLVLGLHGVARPHHIEDEGDVG